MGVFSLSQRTINTATASPAWEVRSITGNKPKLLSLEFTNQGTTNTAPSLGIGRASVVGVSPTSPQTFVDEDDGNAPSPITTACVAWGTAPQVPAAFNRRYILGGGTLGTGFIANFPAGLGLASGGSVVLWIINICNIGDVAAVVNE